MTFNVFLSVLDFSLTQPLTNINNFKFNVNIKENNKDVKLILFCQTFKNRSFHLCAEVCEGKICIGLVSLSVCSYNAKRQRHDQYSQRRKLLLHNNVKRFFFFFELFGVLEIFQKWNWFKGKGQSCRHQTFKQINPNANIRVWKKTRKTLFYNNLTKQLKEQRFGWLGTISCIFSTLN